ncbi:MAG: LysR family transcriptional regulator, partial [Proteobacteria bacterium]|nr:LysR family transcriptional regulator [Pseudomonadota bacterium]
MITGSVTKAARNIGRTQPAISALIAGLEGSIGYALFERRAGRLHPVPEAHFLLEETSSILKQINMLDNTMQSMGALEIGQLRISCLPVFADRLMPELISKFIKGHDGVRVSMVSERSNEVYSSLASQQFEIGLAEVAPKSPLVETDEMTLECVCAVPSNDPLALKPVITPADLDGRAMASFVPQHQVRQRLHDVFKNAVCDFNVRFEMQNATSQYVFIEEGQACAIMSPISARNYLSTHLENSKIAFIPFAPRIPYEIAIIRPAHRPLSLLA